MTEVGAMTEVGMGVIARSLRRGNPAGAVDLGFVASLTAEAGLPRFARNDGSGGND